MVGLKEQQRYAYAWKANKMSTYALKHAIKDRASSLKMCKLRNMNPTYIREETPDGHVFYFGAKRARVTLHQREEILKIYINELQRRTVALERELRHRERYSANMFNTRNAQN